MDRQLQEQGKQDLTAEFTSRDQASGIIKELEAKNTTSDYLFKSLPGGYHRCAMDEGYTFLYVSQRFLDILGWTEEELREKFDNKFMNLLHPDDRLLTPAYVEKILTNTLESPYQDAIYRLQGKDGYHWVSDTTMKASVEGHDFFQGFITDISAFISEREQKERELEQRYEIIRALGKAYEELCVADLEKMTYQIVSDPTGNRLLEKMTGPVSDLQRVFSQRNVLAEEADSAAEFLNFDTMAQRLQNKEFVAQEFRGKSGRWFLVTIVAKNRDENGKVGRVLIAARDVSEQKRKEMEYQEELKKAALEAQRANEAKATFLRRMSHDIRTPINGIVGLVEMANRNRDDKEKLWEYRRKTVSALEYLLAIVNNILDMGKVESGKLELESVPFDLLDMFNQNYSVVEMQAGEHDVRLITDIRVQHRKLLGSPTHLSRILMNLTGNAIKYNHAGGTVTMGCEEVPVDDTKANYVFRCADTGIGISKAFQERIFEPFSQEGKESITTYSGSGLGLSIVKALTEAMGGSIRFESQENVGTTFTVTIPFAFADEKQETKEDTVQKEYSLAGKRALLVEDNELNMEIAEMLLSDLGFVITKAQNGVEAVNSFASSEVDSIDFVFMDIMMPVMDGLEAARRIRSLNRPDAKTVPIIAMSANAFEDDIQSSLRAGMDAHLTKPVEPQKLRQTIQSVLAKREAEQSITF